MVLWELSSRWTLPSMTRVHPLLYATGDHDIQTVTKSRLSLISDLS